jgi:hypothetical protein
LGFSKASRQQSFLPNDEKMLFFVVLFKEITILALISTAFSLYIPGRCDMLLLSNSWEE